MDWLALALLNYYLVLCPPASILFHASLGDLCGILLRLSPRRLHRLLGLLLDAHQFFMLRFRFLGLARFRLGRASEGAVRRRRPSRWRESHHRAKGGLEEKRDLCL